LLGTANDHDTDDAVATSAPTREHGKMSRCERALSANVAETPASPKISVEGGRGMHDDKSDGEADRGLVEGAEAPVDDGREDQDPARGRHRRARDRVYETNVFGIVRVTHAMLPLLKASRQPVIVNVASGLGSFGVVTDPGRFEAQVVALAYCSSKSAVTMLTVQYAKALPEMRINVVDPGYTATDLNQNSGPQTVEEGTDAIVRRRSARTDRPGRSRTGTVPCPGRAWPPPTRGAPATPLRLTRRPSAGA
jgi:NAD(P)-dependent dehydrogenase (short-subunit alcohol dehydrogenase family)